MVKKCLLLICTILIYSCSKDSSTPGCFQEEGRKIVATVNSTSGTVVFTEDCGYLIQPQELLDENPTGVLFPCELDPEFMLNGLKIGFSGYIYESFDFEDICADFFEITEIESRMEN